MTNLKPNHSVRGKNCNWIRRKAIKIIQWLNRESFWMESSFPMLLKSNGKEHTNATKVAILCILTQESLNAVRFTCMECMVNEVFHTVGITTHNSATANPSSLKRRGCKTGLSLRYVRRHLYIQIYMLKCGPSWYTRLFSSQENPILLNETTT